jgi:HK97 family phage major capsid protein
MAEDTTKVDKAAAATLQDKLMELAGVDRTKADGDDEAISAVTEFLNDLDTSIERRAKELALTETEQVRIDAEARRAVDLDKATDEILSRAAELRKVRSQSTQQALDRKGEDNINEVTKRSKDILAKAHSYGKGRTISGITALAMADQPMDMRQLIERKTADEDLIMLQKANDDLLLAAHVMGYGTEDKPVERMKELDHWQRWADGFGEVSKALSISGTDTSGYWTPTFYSGDMIETIFQTTDVAGQFPRYPWPGSGSTATIPAEGTEVHVYTAGEATTDDDDPKFTASTPGIGTSVTVTARAFAGRSVWSYEIEEDALFPIMEHVRGKFVRAFARDLDQALLDGDADGTHQDTGYAHAANVHQRLFNGLRKRGLSETSNTRFVSAATYWNAENLLTPLLNMGAFSDPANTICICSHATALKLGFLRDTYDQRVRGDDSVLELGAETFPGTKYRIVRSDQVNRNLNASGIYDATTTTKTYLLWVDKRAWHIHEKVGLTMGVKDEPEKAQRLLYGRQRLGFTHMYGAVGTDDTTTMVYGFGDTTF